jgi:hypothetical protein
VGERLINTVFGWPGALSGDQRATGRELHFGTVIPPSIVCAAMLAVALVTCGLARVDMIGLFIPYFLMSFAATGIAMLVSVFFWVLTMAREGSDAPLRKVAGRIRSRAALLLLPTVVMALFLVSYTAAKTAIAFLVGFGWDQVWTDVDRFIFREDAWRIAQGLLGLRLMPLYAWFYTFGWGAAFMVTAGVVAINARPRQVGIVYTAMFLTWLIGGWLMALALSAAGPAFTYLFNPALGEHFGPLHRVIDEHLLPDNSLRLTQKYLALSIDSHIALKGGGISAMPSMHLAAASIYVFAARKTRWFAPAVLFWLTIFLLSAYFGYHYWVDGLVAAAVAWVCWRGSELLFASMPDVEGKTQWR